MYIVDGNRLLLILSLTMLKGFTFTYFTRRIRFNIAGILQIGRIYQSVYNHAYHHLTERDRQYGEQKTRSQ